jgi:hypothetical protein
MLLELRICCLVSSYRKLYSMYIPQFNTFHWHVSPNTVLKTLYRRYSNFIQCISIPHNAQIIHCLVHRLFNRFPIAPSLDKLVNVLCPKSQASLKAKRRHEPRVYMPLHTLSYLSDLCKIFSILHDEHMSQHLRMQKVCHDIRNLDPPVNTQDKIHHQKDKTHF